MPKNQNTRYPLVVGLLSLAGLTALFLGGIPIQAPLENPLEQADETAKKPVPIAPDSKPRKAGKVRQLQWRLVHIPKPSIEDLRACLSALAFPELKVFGHSKRLILVDRSIKGTAELKLSENGESYDIRTIQAEFYNLLTKQH